jgi:hypothetical protein
VRECLIEDGFGGAAGRAEYFHVGLYFERGDRSK